MFDQYKILKHVNEIKIIECGIIQCQFLLV